MLFVSLIRWWYGPGWLDQASLVRERLDKTADFFSIGLSLRSLFKPFRQIDAQGARKGSLEVVLRSYADQLFSRFFGAVVRSFLIVIGCVALVLETLAGGLRLAVWPLLPVAPIVALPLSFSGWLPWR